MNHQVIHLSDEADANLRRLCEQTGKTRKRIVEELIREESAIHQRFKELKAELMADPSYEHGVPEWREHIAALCARKQAESEVRDADREFDERETREADK